MQDPSSREQQRREPDIVDKLDVRAFRVEIRRCMELNCVPDNAKKAEYLQVEPA